MNRNLIIRLIGMSIFVAIMGVIFINMSSAVLSNPTVYYKFNETGFPLVANDTTGLMNLSLINNGITMQIGKLGNSIRINNTGSQVATNRTALPNSLKLDQNNFTIAFWINGTNGDGGNGFNIFSDGNGANTAQRWGIGTSSAGLNNISFQTDNGDVAFAPNTTLNGTYNRVVFVREGTGANKFRIYVNNRNYLNTTLANNFSDISGGYKIDGANAGSKGINIDDFRIYNNYAWTVANVNTDYNSGNGQEVVPFGIAITLTSPSDQSIQINSTLRFNSTFIMSSGNLLNATLYLYRSSTLFNNSNISLRGTTNFTSFNISNLTTGSYKWAMYACANDSLSIVFCSSSSNFTFTIGSFVEEFESTVIEGQSTGVNLNITFDGINQNILALLYWNNTRTSPTKTIINSSRIRFTSSFIVPIGTGNLTGVNITHYWRYYLPDNSLNDTTVNTTQQVFSLGIDNCTSFSSLLLNYTMYDEDTIARINGTSQNASIQVQVNVQSLASPSQQVNLSRTYANSSQALVCISQIATGFRIDAQAQYTANNYVVEFANIQNATLSASNFPQHIGLYPLLSSRSQEFLVTFKDTNFAPVSNALISISRKYIGEGLFRTVESPLTNVDGQALVHLVLGDVIYTIQVSKNGRILGTYENIVAFCTNIATGDCTINLNQLSSGTQPYNFNTLNNVAYRFEFNRTARTISSIFTTLDGSNSLFNLTGILFDNRGNTTVCTDSVTTSSGTLFCIIPTSVGNSTIKATFYKDGVFIANGFFSLTDGTDTGFGSTGVFLAFILYITLALMMISSGAGIVIGAILGLIFAGLLNLYTSGGIIGLGSTILWFIIAGAIILWKINQGRNN